MATSARTAKDEARAEKPARRGRNGKSDEAGLSREQELEAYRSMLLIRRFEERARRTLGYAHPNDVILLREAPQAPAIPKK